MRTRSDHLVQTTGFSKTSDVLLKVIQQDDKASVTSEGNVIVRLHSFFIALEYLNMGEFRVDAGPLKYLAELEEWHHENPGLAGPRTP